MEGFSTRDQIVQLVNKLYIYTDYQRWEDLQKEVFTERVDFDMSSLGGEVANKTAKSICDGWAEGFVGLDSVNHLGGNYLVTISDQEADVFAYATATHYKASATLGKTRDFVGSYELHLIKTPAGWRINKFKYNLKYAAGNLELK